MYQQQSYYPQQQYKTFTQNLKGRPVTSLEEARATAIDFDGSIFYFPDIANNCIYTKQINLDGTVSLSMYELKEIPAPVEVSNKNYITRDEFETALSELKNMFAVPAQKTGETAKPQKENFNF